jgi:beta-glucosidase
MSRQFLWGAATSAHQVEGYNIHNDWWQWEKTTPGTLRSGVACDHYHLFAADFALARELGHNAHRLSLEWSRLEVKPGEWNTAAFTHYREVLEVLRAQGLTSFVTLHHFTNPQWLATQGGWLNQRTPQLFGRYVRKVAEELGDLVDFWVTINEPVVYAHQSYQKGIWPPQQRSWLKMWRVLRRMAEAHQLAYHLIHQRFPHAPVGIAHSVIDFPPGLKNWAYNHWFLARTRGTHDYLGLNYYFSDRSPEKAPVSDINWPIDAQGLTRILLQMRLYKLPIYITENGLADAADTRRADFIRSHIRAIEAAQAQGVDVRGYLHWSLLDNFEWEKGFTPRFGLVAVDYATQTRRPRRSAYVYRAIIEKNHLSV